MGMGVIGDTEAGSVVSAEREDLDQGLRQAAQLVNSCLQALESEFRVGHGVRLLRKAEQRIASLVADDQTPDHTATALLAARDTLSAHLLAGVMLKEADAAPAVGWGILRRAAVDCQASLNYIRQLVHEPVA